MGVRLPAEYQEVEYLKSTGTQYIDLGLNSPMVNGCFSVKTMIDYDTPGNTQFLGCNTDNSNKLPKVSIENTNFNLRQSGNKGMGSSLKGSIVVMTSDRNGNVYVNNVKRGTINTVSRTGNGYYLFNALPSYMQYAAKAKIYSFNVWDDEKQFIDLIPCYRKFDSKPGMYDLVSGTFFMNAGTGEFVVGPDVIDSISPWLAARRRSLMLPIPDGYVKNGLVFFLDGTQKLDADSWTDIISGKKFDLKNCTLGTNGVVFNGSTSYAERSGLVSRDWSNETIEVCMSGGNLTSSSGIFVFAQPFIDSVGISFRCGYHTTNRGRAGIGLDDATRAYPVFNSSGVKTFSACDRVAVVNGVLSSYGNHSTSYGKNLMGKTFIGAGPTVNNDGLRLFFRGTIYAIRIYNRKLSVAEMQANQQVDANRYGLSI